MVVDRQETSTQTFVVVAIRHARRPHAVEDTEVVEGTADERQ